MIHINVIATPRPVPRLQGTIESLRQGGFNQTINIIANPGVVIQNNQNTEVFLNEKTSSLSQNWKSAIKRYLKSEEPWIMMVEDDVECVPETARIISEFLASIKEQRIGFISGYTPKAYTFTWNWLHTYNGWAKINRGWDTWGTQCIIMPRTSVEIISKSYLMDLTQHQFDAHLGLFYQNAKMDCYYPVPSLFEHVGLYETTCGLPHQMNCGLRYGEPFVAEYPA